MTNDKPPAGALGAASLWLGAAPIALGHDCGVPECETEAGGDVSQTVKRNRERIVAAIGRMAEGGGEETDEDRARRAKTKAEWDKPGPNGEPSHALFMATLLSAAVGIDLLDTVPDNRQRSTAG